MTITDEPELWALLCALLDLKFGDHGCSHILAGSTPLSQVIQRLKIEFQATRICSIMFPADQWNAQMVLTPDQKEWSRIVKWITETASWNSCSMEEKRDYIHILASPCTVHPNHMNQLLAIPGRQI